MAEVVGLGASILAIAGFGATVVTSLRKFGTSYSGADEKVTSLSSDAALTLSILTTLGNTVKDYEVEFHLKADNFQAARRTCERNFTQLDTALKKARKGHEGVVEAWNDGKGLTPWQKLMFCLGGESEIKDLVGSIETSKSTLQLLLDSINLLILKRLSKKHLLDEDQAQDLKLLVRHLPSLLNSIKDAGLMKSMGRYPTKKAKTVGFPVFMSIQTETTSKSMPSVSQDLEPVSDIEQLPTTFLRDQPFREAHLSYEGGSGILSTENVPQSTVQDSPNIIGPQPITFPKHDIFRKTPLKGIPELPLGTPEDSIVQNLSLSKELPSPIKDHKSSNEEAESLSSLNMYNLESSTLPYYEGWILTCRRHKHYRRTLWVFGIPIKFHESFERYHMVPDTQDQVVLQQRLNEQPETKKCTHFETSFENVNPIMQEEITNLLNMRNQVVRDDLQWTFISIIDELPRLRAIQFRLWQSRRKQSVYSQFTNQSRHQVIIGVGPKRGQLATHHFYSPYPPTRNEGHTRKVDADIWEKSVHSQFVKDRIHNNNSKNRRMAGLSPLPKKLPYRIVHLPKASEGKRNDPWWKVEGEHDQDLVFSSPYRRNLSWDQGSDGSVLLVGQTIHRQRENLSPTSSIYKDEGSDEGTTDPSNMGVQSPSRRVVFSSSRPTDDIQMGSDPDESDDSGLFAFPRHVRHLGSEIVPGNRPTLSSRPMEHPGPSNRRSISPTIRTPQDIMRDRAAREARRMASQEQEELHRRQGYTEETNTITKIKGYHGSLLHSGSRLDIPPAHGVPDKGKKPDRPISDDCSEKLPRGRRPTSTYGAFPNTAAEPQPTTITTTLPSATHIAQSSSSDEDASIGEYLVLERSHSRSSSTSNHAGAAARDSPELSLDPELGMVQYGNEPACIKQSTTYCKSDRNDQNSGDRGPSHDGWHYSSSSSEQSRRQRPRNRSSFGSDIDATVGASCAAATVADSQYENRKARKESQEQVSQEGEGLSSLSLGINHDLSHEEAEKLMDEYLKTFINDSEEED